MQDPQTERIAELEHALADLRSDNARLRRLLDERDAPSELRHRQRNAIAMLRTLVRATAETGRAQEDYVSHLEDRLDAIARVQAAIDGFGQPDLWGLIANELMAYTIQVGVQANLTGPSVHLQPHAAQVVSLAIHELTVNAVEHGATMPPGALDVRWEVQVDAPDTPLTLVWKETGFDGLSDPLRSGFGTEVLTQTIGYALNASTLLAYEPDGLRYTIRLPLPERVGRLQMDAGTI